MHQKMQTKITMQINQPNFLMSVSLMLSDPRSMQGVVVHIWTWYLPTGSLERYMDQSKKKN